MFPRTAFFLSLYTAWRSLSSIIGRCTLYTPGTANSMESVLNVGLHFEKNGLL